MIVPVLLFLASVVGVVVAVVQPGMTDLVLVAGPGAVASLILILWGPKRPASRSASRRASRPASRRGHDPSRRLPIGSAFRHPSDHRPPERLRHIVVDGSNVMHWKDGTAQIATLREVVGRLIELGFTPGVVFDANAGYKIGDRYQDDGALGRMLGLPHDRVLVVAKGTPADPVVLSAAHDLRAQIVTNDRYRDWAADHPITSAPGNLVRGGYRDGKLWLDLD